MLWFLYFQPLTVTKYRGRRYRWVFGAYPQITVAKSFSGIKCHINIEYEQKNFFCSFLMVSSVKICPCLVTGPKNLGKKYFSKIAKCYTSLEPEMSDEFHYERYFTYKKLSFLHIAINTRTATFKKCICHKTLHLMLIYFILRNAIGHCCKQTVRKSFTKQYSDRKKQ